MGYLRSENEVWEGISGPVWEGHLEGRFWVNSEVILGPF